MRYLLALGLFAGCVGEPSDDAVDPLSEDVDQDGFPASTDCNDTDATIRPDAVEICDDRDNDCDGLIDDTDGDLDPATTQRWFLDGDRDGYGSGEARAACVAPPGTVANDDDCNDEDDQIHPGSIEACDGVDNDCDLLVDDDDDSLAGNLGVFYPDEDGDGQGDADHPGVEACLAPVESWVQDDRDCNDADPFSFVGAVELCDDVDNDCNGAADDGVPTFLWYQDADLDGFGEATSVPVEDCNQPAGYALNAADCNDQDFFVNPQALESVADGVDSNCDGGEACYADADADGFRASDATVASADLDCADAGEADGTVEVDCDDGRSDVFPGAPEICDQRDNDCDNQTDEDAPTWYLDADGDSYGDDASAMTACEAPSPEHVQVGGDCKDTKKAVNPAAVEVCDGQDNDCKDGIDGISSWWNKTYPYRVRVTVTGGPVDAEQPPIAFDVDFGAAIAATGGSGFLDIDSVRVVDQDCEGGQIELPSQFMDAWVGMFTAGNSVDAAGNDYGGVALLYDEDGDYSTAEILPAGEAVELGVYFGSTDSGSFGPAQYPTDLAATFKQLDNGRIDVGLDFNKGGQIASLTLDAGSPSVLSQADAEVGNGVFIDDDATDPQDFGASLTRIQNGPIVAAARANGNRFADNGSYTYRTTYWVFTQRPQVYMSTQQELTSESTLSYPGEALLGIRPWSSVHPDLGVVTPTTDDTLGHVDLSDGEWGVSLAWVAGPAFELEALASGTGMILSANDVDDVGAGSPLTLADDTLVLDSPVLVVLPHSGDYDAAALTAVQSPPTVSVGPPEAR